MPFDRAKYRALTTLSITVHVAQFPVDALLPHARALTTLRLRDHTGFAEEDRRCPTLAAADVALLAEASPGFSGAEIEQAVVSAAYAAHAAHFGPVPKQ